MNPKQTNRRDIIWSLLIIFVCATELFIGVCCAQPATREPDAGENPYLRCLDLCKKLSADELLCGEAPRYPESECASICAEVMR